LPIGSLVQSSIPNSNLLLLSCSLPCTHADLPSSSAWEHFSHPSPKPEFTMFYQCHLAPPMSIKNIEQANSSPNMQMSTKECSMPTTFKSDHPYHSDIQKQTSKLLSTSNKVALDGLEKIRHLY
jgi:hypothetical protein